MKITILILFTLLIACFLDAGCANQKKDITDQSIKNKQQINTLRNLSTIKDKVTFFCTSLEDVASTKAYISSNSVVILLTPSDSSGISKKTIDSIDSFVMTTTGLKRDKIILKMVTIKGGGE